MGLGLMTLLALGVSSLVSIGLQGRSQLQSSSDFELLVSQARAVTEHQCLGAFRGPENALLSVPNPPSSVSSSSPVRIQKLVLGSTPLIDMAAPKRGALTISKLEFTQANALGTHSLNGVVYNKVLATLLIEGERSGLATPLSKVLLVPLLIDPADNRIANCLPSSGTGSGWDSTKCRWEGFQRTYRISSPSTGITSSIEGPSYFPAENTSGYISGLNLSSVAQSPYGRTVSYRYTSRSQFPSGGSVAFPPSPLPTPTSAWAYNQNYELLLGPFPAPTVSITPVIPSTHERQRVINFEYTCSDSRYAISGSCAATYGNSWATLRSSNLKFGDSRGWHCAWDGMLANPAATVAELMFQVQALCCEGP